MDEAIRQTVSQRLASIRGHLQGIEKMTQTQVSWLELVHQIQAVQAALHKVSIILLDNHLRTCLMQAVRDADLTVREQALRDVTTVFTISAKLNLVPRRTPMTSKTFTVPNISCGHCTHTIETEVGDITGVTRVQAVQDTKQVTIEWELPASWEQIQATLQEINYPPEGLFQIR